jgi:hypothetical protein
VFLEKIVIGHSPESALYAYLNDCYHIQSAPNLPYFFEEYRDFSIFGTSNKKHIWQKLKIYLGFLAKSIDYPDLKQIRIENQTVSLFSDNLLGRFEFGDCYIFETLNVAHDNKMIKHAKKSHLVVDDFSVSRMGKETTHVDPIYTSDSLLNQAYFYNSLRVDGAKWVTDVITVSDLSQEQLHDFEYSDTIVLFKLRKLLEEAGFKGLKEKGKYKNGTDIYKKLTIQHVKRHVTPIDKNTYENTEKVKFMNLQMQEILNEHSSDK